MSKPIEIAVDTNVLLDLADESEIVRDCLTTIRDRIPHFQIVILPTVIQELADLADTGTPAEQELALIAIKNIRSPWGFLPVNCIPVGHGIVEQIGNKLRTAALIPEEEINDSFIVAEAGLRDVSILVSSDSHITSIDANSLRLLLDSCDIGCPLIASPRKIVSSFFQARG
jgi:predicted nucleic acid-binding protein